MKYPRAIELSSEDFKEYHDKNRGRQKKLERATISSVGYFMNLGDSKQDAEIKVTEISKEVKSDLYLYVMGNKQELKDGLQNINTLAFFDQAAKDFIIGLL